MKIDHIVLNISSKYQTSQDEILKIKEAGFLYEPKYGKGTSGFKASNIWIGDEYFELIHIIKPDGGGWKSDWTELYKNRHRGIVCIFFDVKDIETLYKSILKKNIDIIKPEWLKFKWFFNLFTRTMPWKNSYLPFFQKMPFQFGFQQMKDDKSRDFMRQYMYPNSKENGILAINAIEIHGEYTKNDLLMLQKIFTKLSMVDNQIHIELNQKQKIKFIPSDEHKFVIDCITSKKEYNGKTVSIENVLIKLTYSPQF